MKFEKYTDVLKPNHPRPERMKIGQVSVRTPTKDYKAQLKTAMRRAMKMGFEFSTGEEGCKFAIRRDK